MKVRRITLKNFRGVQQGTVLFDGHALLVGSNSVGKSTICEALDLVLGPERMFRRPVIDEYDFYAARYQEVEGALPEVRIEVILTELSPEAQRRFGGRIRRWSAELADFIDTTVDAVEAADEGEWCLPVVFLGRFDPDEDDFTGGTYFAHPEMIPDNLSVDEPTGLGAGLKLFTREDKRLCGFLYLRPNRTGNRALSFQRGSLLDTIVRLESQMVGPLWEKVLRDLDEIVVASEESGFVKIRTEVRQRVDRFLGLADDPDAINVRASELTREHLREVLRLFVATQPGAHGVPFNRLSTGSLNLLVFALLTYIAELKGDSSVIFAMEEPEIALPPHAQRRLVDFVVDRMGQVIITSHSPYIIERFGPDHVVVLARDEAGTLTSTAVVLPADFKLRRYRDNRRQFAEAVLARAVLVVEGETEAAVFPAIADVLDQDETVDYMHLDLAGISIFNASNDVSVPLYAPVFANMGKPVFGIHDTPKKPLEPEIEEKNASFSRYHVILHAGIEHLLVREIPAAVQRRFAASMTSRSDYPTNCGCLADTADDETVRAHVQQLLKIRKGSAGGYAALLIAECTSRAELPPSLADFLIQIDADLGRPSPAASNHVAGPDAEPNPA